MYIKLWVLLCTGFLINCLADVQWTYETFTNRLQAAKDGNAIAQTFIGLVYSSGAPEQGIEQDYAKAVKWLTKGANAGIPHAQFGLATCYQLGNGVKQDYQEALKWHIKAADQGHTDGMYYAGSFYYLGYGCESNLTTAIKYLDRAASSNDVDSLTLLGLIYYEKGDYPGDFERAKKYLKKAIELGDDDAKQHLAEVEQTEALIQYTIDYQKDMIESINETLKE